MRFLGALLLLVLCNFGAERAALAESLSADAVFGSSEESAPVDPQSAEQKLARTKKLFADKDHATEAGKAAAAAWKSEADTSTLAGTGFKMLQGLALCVGVLLVGMHFFKKFNPQNNPRAPGRNMRIIEKMSIAPKTSLILAHVDGRKVLFAVGNDRVSFFPQQTQEELPAHFDNSLDLLCQDDVKTSDA